MHRYLSLFCLVLLLGATAAGAEVEKRTLSVTGTAEVEVAPDICYMTLIVTAENRMNAAKAYSENNLAAQAVADAVKAQGVDPKDVQTSGFNIAPRYRHEDRTGKRVFEGYTVTHTLGVKVRELAKVSAVLDAAVGAGVTEVSNVNFTVENPKKYLADARIEAIKAARAKAETIAAAAGVELLRPMTISEFEPSGWNRMYAQSNVQLRAGSYSETGASLEPGQVALSHSVSITYELK